MSYTIPLNGVKLPASDLSHMIAGGGLQNNWGREYLEAFLADNQDQNILILPKDQVDQLVEELKRACTILEQERQLLASYGMSLNNEEKGNH